MNAEYGQRLMTWRREQKLSQRGLGSVMGVSQGYISDIESGRSKPSRNFLLRLTERFGVSADWILFGVGVPETERFAGFATRKGGKRIEPPDLGMPMRGDFRFGPEEFYLVERMDLDVSAGPGLVPVDGGEGEMFAFPREWMMRHQVAPDLAVLVRVKGDSMAPTIPDGSLILVDCLDRELKREGIFAFNREDQSYVKRLIPSAHDDLGRPTVVRIISDNSKYPPDGVIGEAITELRMVGKVKCVIAAL